MKKEYIKLLIACAVISGSLHAADRPGAALDTSASTRVAENKEAAEGHKKALRKNYEKQQKKIALEHKANRAKLDAILKSKAPAQTTPTPAASSLAPKEKMPQPKPDSVLQAEKQSRLVQRLLHYNQALATLKESSAAKYLKALKFSSPALQRIFDESAQIPYQNQLMVSQIYRLSGALWNSIKNAGLSKQITTTTFFKSFTESYADLRGKIERQDQWNMKDVSDAHSKMIILAQASSQLCTLISPPARKANVDRTLGSPDPIFITNNPPRVIPAKATKKARSTRVSNSPVHPPIDHRARSSAAAAAAGTPPAFSFTFPSSSEFTFGAASLLLAAGPSFYHTSSFSAAAAAAGRPSPTYDSNSPARPRSIFDLGSGLTVDTTSAARPPIDHASSSLATSAAAATASHHIAQPAPQRTIPINRLAAPVPQT